MILSNAFLCYFQVTKSKKWREIATAIKIGASSSAGFTLKKNYCKFLFAFVCKRDLGGADPAPILAQVEGPQKKEKAPSEFILASANTCSFVVF